MKKILILLFFTFYFSIAEAQKFKKEHHHSLIFRPGDYPIDKKEKVLYFWYSEIYSELCHKRGNPALLINGNEFSEVTEGSKPFMSWKDEVLVYKWQREKNDLTIIMVPNLMRNLIPTADLPPIILTGNY